MNRRRLLPVLVAAVLLAVVVVAVALLGPPSGPVESEYGYSVTLATNATLSNVTLYLPYPASADGGDAPFDAAFEGRAETVSVPGGWQVEPVETEHGRMLRVTATEMPTRRRSDGHRYETHTLSASVPAGHDIDTVEPIGSEPLLRPAEGFEAVPCPNQGGVPTRSTCHVFESRLYARYDAPANADVDVFVTSGGYEDLGGSRGRWYSERVITRLEGPRDGWVEVSGDLQAGAGSGP
jgi:hypothetical protein